MNNVEIVQAAVAALESEKPASAAPYFADDFIMIGTVPRPLDKEKFLTLMTAFRKAFSDYNMNLKIIREKAGGVVRTTLDPVGRHTGVFVLPGITPIQPTGIEVALPRHLCEFTLCDGKISRIVLAHTSGGGLVGLLEYLGVEIPHGSIEKMFT